MAARKLRSVGLKRLAQLRHVSLPEPPPSPAPTSGGSTGGVSPSPDPSSALWAHNAAAAAWVATPTGQSSAGQPPRRPPPHAVRRSREPTEDESQHSARSVRPTDDDSQHSARSVRWMNEAESNLGAQERGWEGEVNLDAWGTNGAGEQQAGWAGRGSGMGSRWAVGGIRQEGEDHLYAELAKAKGAVSGQGGGERGWAELGRF